jgi:tetratricopeptide (TPR) repeat protein
MKKSSFLLATLILVVSFTKAQGLADAIKMLSYGKAKTARETLNKLIAANSKDAVAIYWLGQTMIAEDDVKGAKSLYQKALQDGVNDPYMWVGTAHTDLLEGGDLNSSKQRFEQAITATKETKGKNKGKDNPAILNIIGRANCIGRLVSDGSSKYGDPLYAIEKLKTAGEIDLTTPDYFITMGICYRKMGGEFGGDAQKAYTEAIQRDPKNAQANHLIGKIYLSQNNKPFMEQYFNAAIAADPSYGPVYLDYYTYYSNRDVNVAKENIEKYLQNSDKDCRNDYFYADYLFRAGKYSESLAKAKELESTECKARVNILFAYNNDRLNDSLTAKKNIDDFFATAPADKIEVSDYDIAIKVYSRFKGLEKQTVAFISKAMDADTSKKAKIDYANQAADLFGKAGMGSEQVTWLKKAIDLKGNMSEADHYKLTNAAFVNKDYTQTVELAKAYLTAFPDRGQPVSFLRRSAIALDVDSTKGIAIPHLEYLNSILEKDIEKNKKTIFNNLYYMLIHFGDKTKNYPKAIEVLDKMLAIFPTVGSEENNFASQQKTIITNVMNKQSTTPKTPTTPTPPKTGGKGAANSGEVVPANTNSTVTTTRATTTVKKTTPIKKKK